MTSGDACVRRWALATCLLVLASACSSGPSGPVNEQSYEQQIASWRRDKDTMLRSDPESPIPAEQRPTFAGLTYYPIEPADRVPAALTEDRSGGPLVVIELETSQRNRDKFRKVGTLSFTLNGALYHLTAFADVKAATVDRLFVPFGDETNDTETYGGGRFLDLDRTPTGLYDLDFNRAYHPYCVYNHSWECPVPPRENRLPVAIRAGERLPK